jgi:hypothetical protein
MKVCRFCGFEFPADGRICPKCSEEIPLRSVESSKVKSNSHGRIQITFPDGGEIYSHSVDSLLLLDILIILKGREVNSAEKVNRPHNVQPVQRLPKKVLLESNKAAKPKRNRE